MSQQTDAFLESIAALRERCPWMGALDHRSLLPYLAEESGEVAQVIEEGGSDDELREELGDVLLQVVLHARLAQERGAFTFEDVARTVREKMVRRNPHVFAPDGALLPEPEVAPSIEEIEETWQRIKREEKPDALSRKRKPHKNNRISQ